MKSDAQFKLGKRDFYNESIQHPVGKMTAGICMVVNDYTPSKLLSYDRLYDQ
ncbi:hypothetical protein ACT7DA_06055 [Bacillus pacificus]